VQTGQLAHAAVDLGLEARLTVSATPQTQMEERASKKTRQILMVKLERSTTDQNTSHPLQKGSGISWFPVDDQHFAIGCRKYAE
jgi:hypothetical protein